MLQRLNTEPKLLILFLLGLILTSPAKQVFAREVSSEVEQSLPCAYLNNFGGDVQIFDESREHRIQVLRKARIPCGGWVSVTKGWAEIRHRDGQEVRVGSDTFVGFPENNSDGHYKGDHVVLYRGQVYVHTDGGQREFRVASATARARLSRGTAIVVYSEADEETQLIGLENVAWIENRYEASRPIQVRSGEASSMNIQLLRVIPSIPRAVSIASLRAKLSSLSIGERQTAAAVHAVQNRQERKFASNMEHNESRRPASVSNYERHSKKEKDDSELYSRWVKKMVAGEKVGEAILFPDQFYGRPQKVKIHVEDTGLRVPASRVQHPEQEAERKRLLEELSSIRVVE
ncbi:MAG: FecR domain-containing protein [Bdellovibrionota bacterium]